jgi:hypothetical protein
MQVNRFWRNTRTEKHHPDDVLDTNLPPVVLPVASRRKTVCEFCECQVTPNGEVIVIGEKAKNFRKHDEILEKRDAEIRRLTEEISALKAERDALRGGSAGSGHRAGHRIG